MEVAHHETGSQNTDQVSDGDHDDTRVLELGTGDVTLQDRLARITV